MNSKDFIYLFAAGVVGVIIGAVAAAIYFMTVGITPAPSMNGNGAAGTMPAVNTFEECLEEGNPVMESFPRQCRTPDGRLFVEGEAGEPDDWTDTPGTTPPSERPPSAQNGDDCVPAGCSGTICADADEADTIVTTCEYRQEYACYELTTCERQADGECGWTETSEFTACLQDPPPLR